MKKTNIASSVTAIANGMCKVDESVATVVYAITRDEWNSVKR